MSKIPLRNKDDEIVDYALIDEDDFERVNIVNWYQSTDGYACNSKYGRMHRFIINAKKGDPKIDHKNGNRLDNRKSNLRSVTDAQNAQNKSKLEGCTSKYIGVYFHNQSNKWDCCILQKHKLFEKEEHAAWWYDKLAQKHYGSEAKINGLEKPADFEEPEEKEYKLPKGVYLTKNKNYIVQIQYNKKRITVGTFKTLEEAQQAYNKKAEEFEKIKDEERILKEIVRNQNGIAIINEFLVDDDKYHELIKYSWNNVKGYAQANIKGKKLYMHRYLINAQENDVVDHINNNSKDNRMFNLRKSNYSANGHNKIKNDNCTSQYIGVYYDTITKKFRSKISRDGKTYYLGRFTTEEKAAKIRDEKALELYGEFAKLNFQ